MYIWSTLSLWLSLPDDWIATRFFLRDTYGRSARNYLFLAGIFWGQGEANEPGSVVPNRNPRAVLFIP